MKYAITFFAVTAVLFCVSQVKSEDMSEKSNVKPGEQILLSAELPLALGGEWTGGDAMPLGGPNPVDSEKKETIKYWLFMPSDDSAKTDDGYPLMLFLHGAGERGDNAELVKVHGPAMLCAQPETAKTWKFITVSPQCPGVRFWSPAQLRVLIEKVCDEYPVDRSRVYVTGLSMGGFGTWGLIANSSDLIAAAAPICGGYPLEFAPKMTKTPIWAFHGTADGAVKYDYSRLLVDKVRELGNPEVKFTSYPGATHNVWTRTYDDPKLYDWFLQHKLTK
ncbi:MAG: dienelactone hydrolase family protein [Thermoguttaceae bacterium]|nr:dienelactone hydrolase family protein [Thermoguttaceae bacterium]